MKRVSLHGGHSGQFCDHARDTLAEIVAAYHAAGLIAWPDGAHAAPGRRRLYPDEVELGRTASRIQARFADYVTEARRLKREYGRPHAHPWWAWRASGIRLRGWVKQLRGNAWARLRCGLGPPRGRRVL
jgi:hypothetical protein